VPLMQGEDLSIYLAILRHMALNLLQNERSAQSLRRKLNLVGWKDDFLAPHLRFDWVGNCVKNR
jgi:hypothetical protein